MQQKRIGPPTLHLAFTEALSRFMIWLAVAAWVAVAGAFAIRRVRE